MKQIENESSGAVADSAALMRTPESKQSNLTAELVKQNLGLLSPAIEAEYEMASERAESQTAAPIPQPEGKREGATVRQLRGYKNDRATIAELCTPWTYVPNMPTELMSGSKDAYVKWRNKKSTEH